MTESHTVLDRQLSPSTQEISTLDHNLGKTGNGGRHSVNALISMPIPEAVPQVDQQLPPITEMHMSDHDLEKSETSDSEKASISIPIPETENLDIEHVPVQNDPRKWSSFRKHATLALISSASLVAGLGANIQNPAVEEMETELPATPSQFSLSIALFILFQGMMPLFWSAISEVKGRKLVYLGSLSLCTIGTIVVALSHNIKLVIGFRCVQGAGSSAVIAIGAATLADIFDPAVRGKKLGIYYSAPLLGPAVGSIFGGVLTSAFNWRAIFWFLSIISGLSLLSFILFFRDTFRRERSLNYQTVIRQRRKAAALSSLNKQLETFPAVNLDLSLADVNPLKPLGQVLRRKNNVIVLIASGFQFAFMFLIAYASSRTLATAYGYSPIKIGFVTLSFGVGSIAGSVWGGRWSDYELARLKAANGGNSYPEMRLRSTFLGLWGLPPCALAFGWISAKHVHISAICVFLFLCGFFLIWSYSSTLAYLVDANNGRSSTAVALNSAFRGGFAFVATEIAVPMQDAVGDGWLYTIWAGLMLLSGSLNMLVWWKGGQWREAAERREAEHAKRFDLATTSNTMPSV